VSWVWPPLRTHQPDAHVHGTPVLGEYANSVKARFGMAPVTGTDDGATGYGAESDSPSAISLSVMGVVGGLSEEEIPPHGNRRPNRWQA
jgi:hypothetical protein